MAKHMNHQTLVKPQQVFNVLVDWYTPENGGRQQIPLQGVYYCTTEILQSQKKYTWSIALKLNEMSPHEADMWFLFDHDECRVETGQIYNLFEGPRCVGQIMIQRIKDSDALNFK
jgi:tRNA U34 2-thiouridine synthase MnmA/TrmU